MPEAPAASTSASRPVGPGAPPSLVAHGRRSSHGRRAWTPRMDVAPWTTRDEGRQMICVLALGLGDTPPDAVPHPELTPHQEIARRILGAAQSLRPKMVIYSITTRASIARCRSRRGR